MININVSTFRHYNSLYHSVSIACFFIVTKKRFFCIQRYSLVVSALWLYLLSCVQTANCMFNCRQLIPDNRRTGKLIACCITWGILIHLMNSIQWCISNRILSKSTDNRIISTLYHTFGCNAWCKKHKWLALYCIMTSDDSYECYTMQLPLRQITASLNHRIMQQCQSGIFSGFYCVWVMHFWCIFHPISSIIVAFSCFIKHRVTQATEKCKFRFSLEW